MDLKIVENSAGIRTEISTSLEGQITVYSDGYLKAKYMKYPKLLKPFKNLNEIKIKKIIDFRISG